MTHDIFSMITIHSALLLPQAPQAKFEYVRDAITGKKVKYQFWNNTGISVVLYWGIIGMFTRIPTLEK